MPWSTHTRSKSLTGTLTTFFGGQLPPNRATYDKAQAHPTKPCHAIPANTQINQPTHPAMPGPRPSVWQKCSSPLVWVGRGRMGVRPDAQLLPVRLPSPSLHRTSHILARPPPPPTTTLLSQHLLDAVLYATNRPKRRHARGARSGSAFPQGVDLTPICIIPPSHFVSKFCAFPLWLQSSRSWGVVV